MPYDPTPKTSQGGPLPPFVAIRYRCREPDCQTGLVYGWGGPSEQLSPILRAALIADSRIIHECAGPRIHGVCEFTGLQYSYVEPFNNEPGNAATVVDPSVSIPPGAVDLGYQIDLDNAAKEAEMKAAADAAIKEEAAMQAAKAKGKP